MYSFRIKGNQGDRWFRKEQIMRAENLIYAEKLEEVARLRREYRQKIEDNQTPLDELEYLQYQITRALHESALYANEAYVTGAAVLHVVGNKQLLSDRSDDPLGINLNPNQGKNLKIKLTADQFMHAFNENMAFVFKELTLYSGDTEQALIKSSKYLYRAGIAAERIKKISRKPIYGLTRFKSPENLSMI